MRSHRCDFRHLDLRGLEANGIDFSKARLKAQASRARGISGGFFATELSAAEVALSIQHGARQRYRK